MSKLEIRVFMSYDEIYLSFFPVPSPSLFLGNVHKDSTKHPIVHRVNKKYRENIQTNEG